MRRLQKAIALGLGTGGLGILLLLSPLGWMLEERFGLSLLFRARGPLEPPADVVMVSLDLESADRLGLPRRRSEWPRDVYARLITRLDAAGAAVIVMDLIFDRERLGEPGGDAALAEAIRGSGRVLLLEMIEQRKRELEQSMGEQRLVVSEQVVRPAPPFVSVSLGLAPFPLPKVPTRVSQFWAFRGGAEPRASLPALALQAYALPGLGSWRALLAQADPAAAAELPANAAAAMAGGHIERWTTVVRTRFRRDPELGPNVTSLLAAAPLTPERRRLVTALADLYAGPDSRYLNFYGPAGQVPTIPLHRLLAPHPSGAAPALPELAGRAVFVGVSEQINLHEDGFTTVFSRPDGIDLSGVEIAATAFANLLDRHLIEPLTAGWTVLLVAGFGLIIGVVGGACAAPVAIPLALLLGASLFASAQLAFARAELWLPIVLPLAVQLPLGLFGGLLLQYGDAQRARRNLARGIGHYLPKNIAARLAEAPLDPAAETEFVYAVCLVADVAGFTRLAEQMEPRELNHFLCRYFEDVFSVIERHGGIVTDLLGDSVTAVWPAKTPARRLHVSACRAALEIELAVSRFNRRWRPRTMPMRIGLNAGCVMVGNVGGAGRFAYSVVGDVVNAASRIEQLNKQLGTGVLATAAVVANVEGLVVRPVGQFRLYGKQQTLPLVELVGRAGHLPDPARCAQLLASFAEALAAFEQRRWQEAVDGFRTILAEHPDDGPSRFYLHRCERYAAGSTAPARAGVVELEHK